MKKQNGITLIALIITIIVLLILAVVTINSLQEGGIVTHAENATDSYKKAQVEEEIDLYSMEYYMNNKRSMKEETVNTMKIISKETGVSPEKLTVHYNKFDGSEYVLYRIDKTTEAERTTLEGYKNEELGIDGVKPLRGDFDLDGVLTKNDAKSISKFNLEGNINGEEIFDENDEVKEKFAIFFEVTDINKDYYIDNIDAVLVVDILEGRSIYTGGYVE